MAKRLPYWETIEYIGGGYVLQKKMAAILNGDGNKIKKRMPWTEVMKREEETRQSPSMGNGGPTQYKVNAIKEVSSVHRIVHASELEGVDVTELSKDAVKRYGSEMEL